MKTAVVGYIDYTNNEDNKNRMYFFTKVYCGGEDDLSRVLEEFCDKKVLITVEEID